MILNFILLLVIIVTVILLYRQLKQSDIDRQILPDCKFIITNPEFEIENTVRVAKYKVFSKIKNRYFRDFPLGFKFYSNEKFRSKIKIIYNVENDDEKEVIYDRIVEFDDTAKEHIYYINDIIVGAIEFEIYTNSYYGKPTIDFEILQSNICHMTKDHKIKIEFPE